MQQETEECKETGREIAARETRERHSKRGERQQKRHRSRAWCDKKQTRERKQPGAGGNKGVGETWRAREGVRQARDVVIAPQEG